MVYKCADIITFFGIFVNRATIVRYRRIYIVDHAKPNFSKPQRDDSGCLS